jgi:hypothetical protein
LVLFSLRDQLLGLYQLVQPAIYSFNTTLFQYFFYPFLQGILIGVIITKGKLKPKWRYSLVWWSIFPSITMMVIGYYWLSINLSLINSSIYVFCLIIGYLMQKLIQDYLSSNEEEEDNTKKGCASVIRSSELSDEGLIKWINKENYIGSLDLFDRGEYINRISSRLNNHAVKRGVVVVGKFGSGKTSMLRSVADNLRTEKLINWNTTWFNAWGCDTKNGNLTKLLLQEIIDDLSKKLETSSVRGVPNDFVSAIGKSTSSESIAKLLLDKFQPNLKADTLLGKLDNLLGLNKIKCLVIIENIDRCDDASGAIDEISALFDRLSQFEHFRFIFTLGPEVRKSASLSRIMDFREDLSDANVSGVLVQFYGLCRKYAIEKNIVLVDQISSLDTWALLDETSTSDRKVFDSLSLALNNPRRLKQVLRETFERWKLVMGEVNFTDLLIYTTLQYLEDTQNILSILLSWQSVKYRNYEESKNINSNELILNKEVGSDNPYIPLAKYMLSGLKDNPNFQSSRISNQFLHEQYLKILQTGIPVKGVDLDQYTLSFVRNTLESKAVIEPWSGDVLSPDDIRRLMLGVDAYRYSFGDEYILGSYQYFLEYFWNELSKSKLFSTNDFDDLSQHVYVIKRMINNVSHIDVSILLSWLRSISFQLKNTPLQNIYLANVVHSYVLNTSDIKDENKSVFLSFRNELLNALISEETMNELVELNLRGKWILWLWSRVIKNNDQLISRLCILDKKSFFRESTKILATLSRISKGNINFNGEFFPLSGMVLTNWNRRLAEYFDEYHQNIEGWAITEFEKVEYKGFASKAQIKESNQINLEAVKGYLVGLQESIIV